MAEPYQISPDAPQDPPVGGGVAGGSAGGKAVGRIEAESLLAPRGPETCPNCGKELAEDAVVCVGCGYSLVAGRKLKPEVGVEVAKEKAAEAPGLSRPGWPGLTVLLWAAAGLTLAAAIVAGVSRPEGTTVWRAIGFGVLVAYSVGLHTCTGLAAFFVAARYLGRPAGQLELATARLLVATAAAALAVSVPIGVPFVGPALSVLAGLVVYWLCVMGLFRLAAEPAAVVLAASGGAYLLVQLGVMLTQLVATPAGAAAVGGVGGTTGGGP
ncbi:MAG: zinc ribbon domain-containing protein [Planctomycetaceae bacterium]|nr:zinc ribbon domain-containing protein [Planctomycetaceae bacterium]